jgi:hypothetical protein
VGCEQVRAGRRRHDNRPRQAGRCARCPQRRLHRGGRLLLCGRPVRRDRGRVGRRLHDRRQASTLASGSRRRARPSLGSGRERIHGSHYANRRRDDVGRQRPLRNGTRQNCHRSASPRERAYRRPIGCCEHPIPQRLSSWRPAGSLRGARFARGPGRTAVEGISVPSRFFCGSTGWNSRERCWSRRARIARAISCAHESTVPEGRRVPRAPRLLRPDSYNSPATVISRSERDP